MTLKEDILNDLRRKFPSNDFDMVDGRLRSGQFTYQMLLNGKRVDIHWNRSIDSKITDIQHNYGPWEDVLRRIIVI